MSQLIVGLIAFLLSVLPSTVAKIEKKPAWRFGLPFLVGIIAITGYLVAESSETELKGQIGRLYSQVRSEATKDDVSNLTTHIDNGFKTVVDAIASLCKPARPPKSTQAPPSQSSLSVPPHVSITQARAVSTDAQFKFGLQVTVQSDQQIPASFAIECSGEVGKVDAFMVGQSAYLSVQLGIGTDPDVAIVHFGYPPLTPQSPLVVTILSKDDIRVKQVRPY